MSQAYIYLAIAVAFEVFASTCLQASQQLTRFWPSVGIVVGFGGAFWFFMLTLQYLPLGIVYAMWSGLGIVLITASAFFVFGQKIDLAGLAGMALILAGIVVIHLFSRNAPH